MPSIVITFIHRTLFIEEKIAISQSIKPFIFFLIEKGSVSALFVGDNP